MNRTDPFYAGVVAQFQRLLLSPSFRADHLRSGLAGEYTWLRERVLDNGKGPPNLPVFIRHCQTVDEAYRALRREQDFYRDPPAFMRRTFHRYWSSLPVEDRPVDLCPPEPVETTVRASGWTGRRSLIEQCRVVIELAPAALEGVALLIRDREAGLGNGPPEPVDATTLTALRELHAALEELLKLANGGCEVDRQLAWVRKLANAIFGVAADTGRISVGGIAPAIGSLVPTLGTMKALEVILGEPVGGAGGAAIAAGFIAAAGPLRKQNKAG